MTNKKDDDDRKDLTRIEDLSEFLHQDDPEIDNQFGSFTSSSESDVESSTLINLEELDSTAIPEAELPPELPVDIASSSVETEDVNLEESSEFNFDNNEELNTEDASFDFSEHSEIMTEVNEEISEPTEEVNVVNEDTNNFEVESEFLEPESSFITDLEQEVNQGIENTENSFSISPSETFEEVKNFAQSFSYGTIEGAGNPPYSIIIRNIKFKEEADDILALLKEFAIINDQNIKEMEMAINLGSLLVSQISEYTAIILAHKLRRYDLDLEVGLSDDIHPSKSGENNPKGLTKKSSIKQNVEENYKRPEKNFKISDMIITNASSIQNYKIVKILGIEHAHCTLTEDEISRSAYIHQRILAQDLASSEIDDFKTYKKGQDELHDILLAEIKNKAFKEGANALLSVQFNLNSISDHKQHFMKLTCTCTKVILEHE